MGARSEPGTISSPQSSAGSGLRGHGNNTERGHGNGSLSPGGRGRPLARSLGLNLSPKFFPEIESAEHPNSEHALPFNGILWYSTARNWRHEYFERLANEEYNPQINPKTLARYSSASLKYRHDKLRVKFVKKW